MKVTITYDGRIFDGIDPKKARTHLRKYITELASGTTGNPLYSHFAGGQMTWQEDDPDYARYKKKKYGSTEKFVLTGNAKKAIAAKAHKSKKVSVSYRKKGGYFLMTAALRKMEQGKNVYTIAQKGRFGGLSFTSGGAAKHISADTLASAHASLNETWQALQDAGVDRGKIKRHQFKQGVIEKSLKMDKGSSKRTSRNQRLISANLPGDAQFLRHADMDPVIDQVLETSGYTLT